MFSITESVAKMISKQESEPKRAAYLPTIYNISTVEKVDYGKEEQTDVQTMAEKVQASENGDVVGYDKDGNPLTAKITNGTVTVTQKKVVHPLIFKGKLKLQSIGKEVKKLQERLTELGVYSDTIDGFFGYKTQQAVASVQQSKGMEATGEVDAKTHNIIYSAPRGIALKNIEIENSAKSKTKKNLMMGAAALAGLYFFTKE